MNENIILLNSKNNKIVKLMMFLSFIAFFFMASTPYFLERDTWFLFNHGRYILENGFPDTEPFTLHQNFEFIIPQWLSAVILWFTYNLFGRIGICILNISMFAVTTAVFYKLCMFLSKENYFVSCFSTFGFCLLSCYNYNARPYLFTNLIFLLELYVLELYFNKKDSRYLIALPILSLLLVNFSCAMWPMFFVLFLPYLAEMVLSFVKKIKCDECNKLHLVISFVASFVVGFLNPYGFKGMTYLLRSFGHEEINEYVVEMAAPTLSNTGLPFFVISALIILFYIVHKKGETKTRYFFLTIGCFILGFMAIRNLQLFTFGVLIPFAFFAKDTVKDFKLTNSPKNKTFLKGLCVILACYAAIGFATYTTEYVTTTPEKLEPVGAINAIIEHSNTSPQSDDVAVYCKPDNGSYLGYLGFKNYMDTRMEVFVIENNKQKNVFAEFIDLQLGRLHYKEFVNRYNFDYYLTLEGDTLYTYLEQDENFTKIYEDDDYRVFCPIEE